ncbi:hypothetical protein TNCV_89761 [Trichonephila clavipes]|nr:hypothetical protein TNCV_89761 [Trichonephila clavipes]
MPLKTCRVERLMHVKPIVAQSPPFGVWNHKNCSKEHPKTKMQASHRRRRDCRTLANTPGHLPDITSYDDNHRYQGLVGVDRGCVNKTLHMAPD